MDQDIVAAIRTKLRETEINEGVRMLWAIESGSRAWGFPSPDSDYDCRFVYIRPRRDYMSLFPKRDVIESAPDGVFDVNGWDIQKAIQLLLKGNAVIIEWLQSPFLYQGDFGFRDDFLALAREVVDRDAVASHYLHLAYSMAKRVTDDQGSIRLKRIFYLLRPAMALLWLRQHPGQAVAPMNFRDLTREVVLPVRIVEQIEDLLARKAVTRELGSGNVPDDILAFCGVEISEAERTFSRPQTLSSERREMADAFFFAMADRFAPV